MHEQRIIHLTPQTADAYITSITITTVLIGWPKEAVAETSAPKLLLEADDRVLDEQTLSPWRCFL